MLALTGSPAQAGLIGAAQTVPSLVLGLPAGALIDRWNRKSVMIACDTARWLAFGSVPLAWWLGHLTTWHLYLVAFVHGTGLVFFSIAQLAALPRVVPTSQLARAHSLNTASEGVATLVSPSLGGLIISLAATVPAGAALAYLVDSCSYVVSVISLATIRTPFQTVRSAPARRLQHEIAEGLRYLWSRRDLRLLVAVNTVHRMCFSPVQLTAVVFAQVYFHADARMIGVLFSAAGAGGLVSSVLTPWLRQRVSVGHSMLALVAMHGVGLAVVAASHSPATMMAGLFLGGMMENMTGIVQVSYRLAVIPDELQGRVNSSYRLQSFAAVTVGTALSGFLIATVGPRAVFAILATCMAAIALGTAASDVRRI